MPYIVEVKSAKVSGRARQYPYQRAAVLEVEPGVSRVKMISERAHGVRRIVRDYGTFPARGCTPRSQAVRVLNAAAELADHLNFLEANAKRRRGKAWLATLRERIAKVENVEHQRELVDLYGGLDAYMADAGAVAAHQDETGTLWRRETAAETIAAVEVVCPSTGRRYMLRVPPETATAREGVAWTFGMAADQYHPTHQS